jgi:hypothetical protein
MSSFALNRETGDLDVVNNSIYLNEGLESIRQHVEVGLRLGRGEVFFNIDVGMPWFQEILGNKQMNIISFQEIVKANILGKQGIKEFLEFKEIDFDRDSRKARVNFRALTDLEEILDFTFEI